MPTYRYQILAATGRREAGRLEADDLGIAASRLRENGARILSLDEARSHRDEATDGSASRLGLALARRAPLSAEAKVQALGHLAMMVRSGLSLSNALRLVAPETPHPALREALDDAATRVERGLPFSEALAAHPAIFPRIVPGIVRSAEESGELADGLDRIGEYLRFWADLRRKVLHSLTYPAIVLALAVGVTALLVGVFIPRVEQFVAKGGRSLPGPTRALFDIAHFFQGAWPWLLGALVVGALLLSLAWRRPGPRARLERLLLSLPLAGAVWQASVMARVCGLLAVLLQSGTSLVRALEIGAATLGSVHYRKVLLEALDGVVRGSTLRRSLERPGIPPTVLGVVSAGEESGELPRCFRELEGYYARRLSTRLASLVSLVEPALILGVGGIVALVYLALFSAVLSLARQ
jgi:type IV pilus assembly protein PilC